MTRDQWTIVWLDLLIGASVVSACAVGYWLLQTLARLAAGVGR